MQRELIEIIGSDNTDEEKVEQIIGLARTISQDPGESETGHRRNALLRVVRGLGECNSSEVLVTPGMVLALCLEIDRRGVEFGRVEQFALQAEQSRRWHRFDYPPPVTRGI